MLYQSGSTDSDIKITDKGEIVHYSGFSIKNASMVIPIKLNGVDFYDIWSLQEIVEKTRILTM